MKKKLYTTPEVQIVTLKHNDIIATSNMNVYNESFDNPGGFLAPGRMWEDDDY